MKRIAVAMITGVVASVLTGTAAMVDGHLATPEKKFSYAAGFQFANRVKQGAAQEGLSLDVEAFTAAVRDVLNGGDPALTPEEMQAAFASQQEAAQAKQAEAATGNVSAGDAYRVEYEKKEGVSKTPSGLLYRVITDGAGAKPGPDATVEVHYQGTTIGGEVFDSSVERGVPATFGLKGIIKGWQEALQLMPEGSKWEVVIPPELAYGDAGAGPKIGPGSTLVFEIELLGIK